MKRWLREWLGIESLLTALAAVMRNGDHNTGRIVQMDEQVRKQAVDMAIMKATIKTLQEPPSMDLPDLFENYASQLTEVREAVAEIRERLEMPQKKKSSGRPFPQLRRIAEMGEAAQRPNGNS